MAHPITLDREVFVLGVASPFVLHQTGTLSVGWVADQLTIDPGNVVISLSDGTQLNIHFAGIVLDPVAGDPPFSVPVTLSLVPEPGAMALFGLGLAAVAWQRRRKAASVARPTGPR